MKTRNWHRSLAGGVALALSLTATVAAAAGAASRPPAGGMADEIPVALVNGIAIPRSALVKMMDRMQSRSGSTDAPHGTSQLKTQALRRLILQELAHQEALARGIAVAPSEVDAAVERIRSSTAGGQVGFEAFLAQEAMTEAGLRSLVERNLVLEAIIGKEVVEKAGVDEQDLLAAYERNKNTLATPERVSVMEILFLLDPTTEDSRRQAAALLQGLRDDPARAPRDLVPDGTFIVRELQISPGEDPVLYDAAKKLKPGEISGVITSQQSLHIVQLIEYLPSRQPTFEEVRGVLERRLIARAQQQRLEAWEAELSAKAKIEILKGDDAGR
jgi:parvulin-like peptidyl-prolyl isomerase